MITSTDEADKKNARTGEKVVDSIVQSVYLDRFFKAKTLTFEAPDAGGTGQRCEETDTIR
jgi:hypothetical protein